MVFLSKLKAIAGVVRISLKWMSLHRLPDVLYGGFEILFRKFASEFD